MLVLSRKPGETIRVGRDIVITICGVKGRHVRVGIQAPTDQLILRSEVVEQPRQEGRGDGPTT